LVSASVIAAVCTAAARFFSRIVELEVYSGFEAIARRRLARLGGPIWNEHTDFFGRGGVATWTADRVELYLAQAASVILKL
jgi:hypothetical protein